MTRPDRWFDARRGTVRACTVWACTVWACALFAALPAAAQRPTIVTSLVIEATGLSLNSDQRQAVQEAAAHELALLAGRHFRFAEWRPRHQGATTETAAEFRLHLGAETQPHGRDLHLGFQGRGTEGNELELALPTLRLFAWFEPLPEQEHLKTALVERIRQQLGSEFENDDFLAKLEGQFLHSVTLTRSLQARSDLQSIVLPMPFDALAAAPGSRLGVSFSAPNHLEEIQDGVIELEPVGGVEEGQHAQCVIALFRFPPIQLPQAGGDTWDERIPELVNSQQLRDVRVYMARYVLQTARLAEEP